MRGARKGFSFVGLFLTIIMIVSLMMPTFVFAGSSGEISEDAARVITFTDSKITSDSILKGMGFQSEQDAKKGNVTFISGKLMINNKGVEETLLRVEDGKITVNPPAFKSCKDSDVSKAMKLFVDGLTNSGGNPDTIQQIMRDIQDTDTSVSAVMLPLIFQSTKGDMYQAYKITSPFLNILSIVLGVGAVILILLLLFSTVMDLAYIGLPVWREAQQGKDGGKKHPFGVSYEALTTVTEVEKGLGGGDGSYRNAYILYFRRRALTYIILAICIMYLICGGLSGIIGFVLSLVSGITG